MRVAEPRFPYLINHNSKLIILFQARLLKLKKFKHYLAQTEPVKRHPHLWQTKVIGMGFKIPMRGS
jgi:hypothetical protein